MASAAAILPIEDSIMKIKRADKKAAPTTEAEALRKDPLKNYPQDNACCLVIQDDD